MKVILVKENGVVRVLEGKGEIGSNLLSMRSRLTSGETKYYELDYEGIPGCSLSGHIAALNQCPELLDKSDMIKPI